MHILVTNDDGYSAPGLLILKQALEYRLTILQAEAGYGKSTALAELAGEIQPVIWYQANEEDNDPLVFLLQLCHALQHALPAITNLPTPFLETWDGSQGPLPWRGILDQIINALADTPATPHPGAASVACAAC